MTKRLFDLAVSIPLLIVTAPIMLAAAIAVRRSSPGPAIFHQRRVGRHGRVFNILKFRTMRLTDDPGREITIGADTRITRVGLRLRRWKIDELPQLVNVVRGDMSLVGPRPDVPSYVALYPEALRRAVQSVRPGITDRASIKYRNENDLLATKVDPEAYYRDVILPDKLALGAAYAAKPTLGEDVRIIIATLRTITRD